MSEASANTLWFLAFVVAVALAVSFIKKYRTDISATTGAFTTGGMAGVVTNPLVYGLGMAAVFIVLFSFGGWQLALFISGIGLLGLAGARMAMNRPWSGPLIAGLVAIAIPYSGIAKWVEANIASINQAASCSAEETSGVPLSPKCLEAKRIREAQVAKEQADRFAAQQAARQPVVRQQPVEFQPVTQTISDSVMAPATGWSTPFCRYQDHTFQVEEGEGAWFIIQTKYGQYGDWVNHVAKQPVASNCYRFKATTGKAQEVWFRVLPTPFDVSNE